MNLSGELVKAWRSCGLSKNSFWLGAARPFIMSGTMQRVVGSLIRNMRGAHPAEGGPDVSFLSKLENKKNLL